MKKYETPDLMIELFEKEIIITMESMLENNTGSDGDKGEYGDYGDYENY